MRRHGDLWWRSLRRNPALKQVLRGGGFAAGSTGDKAFKALSGSVLYAYVDPVVFNMQKGEIPVDGFGLGVSFVETRRQGSRPRLPERKRRRDTQAGALVADASAPGEPRYSGRFSGGGGASEPGRL